MPPLVSLNYTTLHRNVFIARGSGSLQGRYEDNGGCAPEPKWKLRAVAIIINIVIIIIIIIIIIITIIIIIIIIINVVIVIIDASSPKWSFQVSDACKREEKSDYSRPDR